MSSTNKRPRSERLAARLAARSLLGAVASQQTNNGANAVAPHNNEANTSGPTAAPRGGTSQPTAPPLTPAAGATDTNNDLLAHMQICAQDLWGRSAGRNKADAATLVEGLSKLQSRQDAERNQAKALGKAQARVRQLQVHLRTAQAELALALPLAQVAGQVLPAQHADFHRITGRVAVGETVEVTAFASSIPSSGATQWLTGPTREGPWCPIAGALCSTYSPDPDDMGKWLACRVYSHVVPAFAQVQPVPDEWDEELTRLITLGYDVRFKVEVIEHNGQPAARRRACDLLVGTRGLWLCKKGTNKPLYSSVVCGGPYMHYMQVRGERGGGDAAKQGLFLFIRKDSVWRLACESPMERNIAITLIQCYVDD